MSLLEARQLVFSPHPERRHEVSFALEQGELLHLRGASGAGKTTLLRTLARLDAPRRGELAFQGERASSILPSVWRRAIAYLPQRPVMFGGTVADNLRAAVAPGIEGRRVSGASSFDHNRAIALLQTLGMASAEDVMKRPAQRLSGGESARVALARALLLQPKVLLADELTSQLDEEAAAAVVACCVELLDAGGALVLVAHDIAPWSSVLSESKELRLGETIAGDRR